MKYVFRVLETYKVMAEHEVIIETDNPDGVTLEILKNLTSTDTFIKSYDSDESDFEIDDCWELQP